MKDKVYWTTKDNRKIYVDTWSDLQHMRNVLKMLIQQQDIYRDCEGDDPSWGDLNSHWGDRD